MKLVYIVMGTYSDNDGYCDIILVTHDKDKADRMIEGYRDNSGDYDNVYYEEHYIE